MAAKVTSNAWGKYDRALNSGYGIGMLLVAIGLLLIFIGFLLAVVFVAVISAGHSFAAVPDLTGLVILVYGIAVLVLIGLGFLLSLVNSKDYAIIGGLLIVVGSILALLAGLLISGFIVGAVLALVGGLYVIIKAVT